MKKLLTFLTLSLSLTLCGCNNQIESSDTSFSSDDTSITSSHADGIDMELLNDLKQRLYELDKEVSKEKETSTQTDDYGGGVYIDTTINSVTTKYNGDFIQTLADAKIESDTTYSYIKEKGLVNDSSYYDVIKFDTDENNKATIYPLSDNYKQEEFALGFSSFFAVTMVKGMISFNESKQGDIYHNFDSINLSTDGNKYFYLKCIIGEDDDFDYKFEISADITIANGEITNSHIVALQSLVNDTNYSYIEKDVTYYRDEIIDYQGEKIDYELYL